MDIATTVPASYLHFNLYIRGTKILLEPLDQDERERYLNTEKIMAFATIQIQKNYLQRITYRESNFLSY